jgi:ATP-dependent helicase/DNAse subunit B
MELKTLSATSISTYQTCPYSWKLRYIYKLLQPDNEAFIVGKALHKALELYHTKIAPEIIIENIKEILIAKDINQEKINQYGLVKQMFNLYLKYPLGGTTKEVEKEFRVSLPNINCVLHGYMDRVTAEHDVIDYKTTNKDYTTKDTKTIQTEIYAFAHKAITGNDANVTFYVINKGKVKRPDYVPQIITTQPALKKSK